MKVLVATTDSVLVSYVRALLDEVGIGLFLADEHMSMLEGSLGILPRRVLVADADFAKARRVLMEAGLTDALVRHDGAR